MSQTDFNISEKSRSVVIRLNGGLGNQMFQYAFGRSYAARHGLILKADMTDFERHRNHNGYELEQLFPIKINKASPKELSDLKGSMNHRIAKRLRKYVAFRKATFYVESTYTFQEPPEPSKGSIYVDGYFLSAKYFNDHSDLIRQDFTFLQPPNEGTERILEELRNTAATSVSIHVRRGDYVRNPTAWGFHGVLGLDYYRSAIEIAKAKLNNPNFYVFSDDPEWCKENLRISAYRTTYINHNHSTDSWQDMLLMSRCRANIIANSSFSWWASWLNNSNPLRIAPSPWFRSRSFNDRDLHLEDTIKLEPTFLSKKEITRDTSAR